MIKKVRRKRLQEGISLRKLGALCGVSFSTLARLERGTGEPDPHTRERLQRWLDSGEGSAPKIRSPAEEGWLVRMERRVAELETRVAQLEKWT